MDLAFKSHISGIKKYRAFAWYPIWTGAEGQNFNRLRRSNAPEAQHGDFQSITPGFLISSIHLSYWNHWNRISTSFPIFADFGKIFPHKVPHSNVTTKPRSVSWKRSSNPASSGMACQMQTVLSREWPANWIFLQTSMISPPAGRSLSLYPKSVNMRRAAFILGFQPIRLPLNLIATW